MQQVDSGNRLLSAELVQTEVENMKEFLSNRNRNVEDVVLSLKSQNNPGRIIREVFDNPKRRTVERIIMHGGDG